MKISTRYSHLSSAVLLLLISAMIGNGAPVIFSASGANPAAIQATVDAFRTSLGGANNGVGGSFTNGRREINWDGVPDAFASPNNLPFDFFNANSPRGVIFDPSVNGDLRVSANATNPTNTVVRFGELDPSYPTTFAQVFSSQRLFGVIRPIAEPGNDPPLLDIVFFIPGTQIPATVSGFGVVFSDADKNNSAGIICYGVDGRRLTNPTFAPASNGGLSFVGVSFNAGERIARIKIGSGDDVLAPSNIDGAQNVGDVVAMDDFIFGEPRASQFHTGDFDGDGQSDSAIYRPATGTWFVLQSGSNTFTQEQFGLNGDVPIDGDFDGDQRADLCIFRPSTGVWFFKRSSNGTTLGAQFGQSGDKPVVGDYDKDGRSDIAFWRPSNGNFFVLRSSSGFSTFFGYPFGQNGDIPVQGGAQ